MFLAAKNRCLPVGRQSIPLVWIFDHYSFHLKSQTNGNTEEDIQQTGRPPCPEQVPAAGIPPYRPLQHGAASPAQGFGPAIGSEARRGRAAAHCLWVSEGAGKKEHRPVFDLLKGLSDNLNQLTRLAHARGIERLEKQIAPVL